MKFIAAIVFIATGSVTAVSFITNGDPGYREKNYQTSCYDVEGVQRCINKEETK